MPLLGTSPPSGSPIRNDVDYVAQAKRDSVNRASEKKNIKGLMAKIQSERKLEGQLIDKYGTKSGSKGFKS